MAGCEQPTDYTKLPLFLVIRAQWRCKMWDIILQRPCIIGFYFIFRIVLDIFLFIWRKKSIATWISTKSYFKANQIIRLSLWYFYGNMWQSHILLNIQSTRTIKWINVTFMESYTITAVGNSIWMYVSSFYLFIVREIESG